MKNKTKKVMAFLASMTMVVTASSVLPYSNLNIIAQAEDENGSNPSSGDDDPQTPATGNTDGGTQTTTTDPNSGDGGNTQTTTTAPNSGNGGTQTTTPDGGEGEEKSGEVAGMSLALDDNIALKLYFDVEKCSNKNITVDNKTFDVSKESNKYAIYTVKVAPKDYKKKISVKIGNADAVDYSVENYINTAKDSDYVSDEDKALIDVMEAYCEEAEDYFTARTNGNTSVEEENSISENDDNWHYYGSSLVLDEGIEIRNYFWKYDDTGSQDNDTTRTTDETEKKKVYAYQKSENVTIKNLSTVKIHDNKTLEEYVNASSGKEVSNLLNALKEYADKAASIDDTASGNNNNN